MMVLSADGVMRDTLAEVRAAQEEEAQATRAHTEARIRLNVARSRLAQARAAHWAQASTEDLR